MPRYSKMCRGKFGVVLSPTPITPIDGLRTTCTSSCGIFRLMEIAAISPALPAPKTRMLLIIVLDMKNQPHKQPYGQSDVRKMQPPWHEPSGTRPSYRFAHAH